MIAALLLTGYLARFVALNRLAAQQAGTTIDNYRSATGMQAVLAWMFRVGFVGSLVWVWARQFLEPTGAATSALATFGLVVMGASAGFALWAQRTMAASWRMGALVGKVGALVDKGPFRISRNPTFVGHIGLFAGLLLAQPSLLQALLTALVIAAAILQVRIEEPVLRRELGEAYAAYARRIPRWLGWPGGLGDDR